MAQGNGYANGHDPNPLPTLAEGDCQFWDGAEIPTLPFVVDSLVPEGMVTLLVGEGGAGKTMVEQVLMTCVATGLDFCGRQTTPGVALGAFAEDPRSVLHIRQTRINEALGVSMGTLAGRSFPQSYVGFDALLWRANNPTGFCAQIDLELATFEEPRLLVLDNAALLFGDVENDRAAVSRFMTMLNGIAIRRSVAIVLSTHTSKSSDGTPMHSASGSTAWVNASRSVLMLDPGKPDDNAPQLIHLKANHSAKLQPIALRWTNGVLLPAVAASNLERNIKAKQMDEAIFSAVAVAWDRNNPLSDAPQASGRYLPREIAIVTGFRAGDAANAMKAWMRSGHLVIDQRTKRDRIGLRVGKWPSHLDGCVGSLPVTP